MFFLSKYVLLWNKKVVGVPTHVLRGKDVTKVGNCNFHKKKKILGSHHDFVREKEDQKLSEKYFIITVLKNGP